jgi:hypothetical protein
MRACVVRSRVCSAAVFACIVGAALCAVCGWGSVTAFLAVSLQLLLQVQYSTEQHR